MFTNLFQWSKEGEYVGRTIESTILIGHKSRIGRKTDLPVTKMKQRRFKMLEAKELKVR